MTGGVSSVLLQSLNAAAKPAGSPPSQTINQQDFLQLFIAQLQHQDPLSPMEPDQLTAQLAQFSSLEQLTTINSHLDQLASASKQATGSALLGLLGKQISFDGGQLVMRGGQAPAVSYALDQPAQKVTATVRSADGSVVRVVELGAQGAGPSTPAPRSRSSATTSRTWERPASRGAGSSSPT